MIIFVDIHNINTSSLLFLRSEFHNMEFKNAVPQSIFCTLKVHHITILALIVYCVDKWTLFHPEISLPHVKSVTPGKFHLALHLLLPKIDRFTLQNLSMYDPITRIYAHSGIQTRPRASTSACA